MLLSSSKHLGRESVPGKSHAKPISGPYDTPIGLDMIYTLASQLITSCPDSNAVSALGRTNPE